MRKKIIFFLVIWGIVTLFFTYGCYIYPHGADVVTGITVEPPSINHWLGTDNLGIDIYAQLSVGYYRSMKISLFAAIVTFIIGGILGVLSGYYKGIIDNIISFLINVFLSIPQLPVMIVIGAFFGQSIYNIVIIVAMFSWAPIAKIVRSKTRAIQSKDYIAMSKKYGGKFLYIFKVHMKDDIMPLLIINSIAVIGRAIVQEASLAFLGLCDPTSKSWGLMINKAVSFSGIYYTPYWKWWLLSPLLSLLVMILIFRLIVREMEKMWT